MNARTATCKHCEQLVHFVNGRWNNVFDWDNGRAICWPCARALDYRWIGLTLFGGNRYAHN